MKLRWLPLLCFAWVMWPAMRAAEGAAPPSKAEMRRTIIATIEGQLAAFRDANPTKAFTFATTDFRRQTTVEIFAKMVRVGYPEVWNNAKAEFGVVKEDGGQAALTVRVFAKDGTSAAYDYILLKETEGAWRIGGVLRHDPRGPDSL